MSGIQDLPSTTWAWIFAGSLAALLLALRATDVVNRRTPRRRSEESCDQAGRSSPNATGPRNGTN